MWNTYIMWKMVDIEIIIAYIIQDVIIYIAMLHVI